MADQPPPPPPPPSTPIPPPPGGFGDYSIPPPPSSGFSPGGSFGPPPPAYPTSNQPQWQPQPPPQAAHGYDPYGASGSASDPFGSFDPTTGAPLQPVGGSPPPPPPPPKQSPPANFKLGALLPPVLKVKLPPHSLRFDEQYFLHLLAASISLTKDEKIRIIDSMGKLKQSQIDELTRIFEEERKKFAELGPEHTPQLQKLAQQHYDDWVDIEMRQQQQHQQSSDQQQADEIRKQLGL